MVGDILVEITKGYEGGSVGAFGTSQHMTFIRNRGQKSEVR